MRTTILAALAAVLIMSGPAAAIDEKGMFFPIGSRSCGQWLEHKRLKGGNSWERLAHTTWLAGFVTGANLYSPGKANYLEGTDLDSAMLWIDKHCADNPLSNSVTAAQTLISELRSR